MNATAREPRSAVRRLSGSIVSAGSDMVKQNIPLRPLCFLVSSVVKRMQSVSFHRDSNEPISSGQAQ